MRGCSEPGRRASPGVREAGPARHPSGKRRQRRIAVAPGPRPRTKRRRGEEHHRAAPRIDDRGQHERSHASRPIGEQSRRVLGQADPQGEERQHRHRDRVAVLDPVRVELCAEMHDQDRDVEEAARQEAVRVEPGLFHPCAGGLCQLVELVHPHPTGLEPDDRGSDRTPGRLHIIEWTLPMQHAKRSVAACWRPRW